jgi:tRNA-dihydrouridine synthase
VIAPTIPPALAPLTLRGVTFDPPLFCAPMARITHCAFRRLVSDFGGYGGLFTEMLCAKMILQENVATSPWLKRRPAEGKVIYQLLVVDTVRLPETLERLATLQPDGIDLNGACPAYIIRRMGGGAGLFADAGRLREILRVMRRHYHGPLTVKIRLGRRTDDWRERLRERLRILEEEGVDAITLQPRFSEERRGRGVRHELYAELAAETRLPLIANGEIMGRAFYDRHAAALAPTAALMIGRIAAARPWIFAQWHKPDLAVDHAEVWERLMDYIAEDFSPQQALIQTKIIAPYFARNFSFGHCLFIAVQTANDFETARARAAAFLRASPTLVREISLSGI